MNKRVGQSLIPAHSSQVSAELLLLLPILTASPKQAFLTLQQFCFQLAEGSVQRQPTELKLPHNSLIDSAILFHWQRGGGLGKHFISMRSCSLIIPTRSGVIYRSHCSVWFFLSLFPSVCFLQNIDFLPYFRFW